MGYYAKDGAYMHDENDVHYRNTYGEPIKTTGGPSYSERTRDSEAQRNLNKYGEPLRGATKEYSNEAKGTVIDLNKIRADRYKNELRTQQLIQEGIEHSQNRREAIKIIVEQKRRACNDKSWLRKAAAKLSGKTFDKMKSQITKEAERRVDKMSPERLEQFVENAKEGRSR